MAQDDVAGLVAALALLLAACAPGTLATRSPAVQTERELIPPVVAAAAATGVATAQSTTMRATSGRGPYPTSQPWQQATIDAYRATHAAEQGRTYPTVPTATPLPSVTPRQTVGILGFLVAGAAVAFALAALLARRRLQSGRPR